MGKDFKEKYERVCAVKDRALGIVEAQINGDIKNVDAEELGEVVDIVKDMAEVMKLCSEAEYYHKITEAMEKNSDPENARYMEKYLPESRFYGIPPIYYTTGSNGGNNSSGGNSSSGNYGGGSNGGSGNRYYEDNMWAPRVYNPNENTMRRNQMDMGRSDMGRMDYMRDMREGRSGMTRKTYMEMTETGADANTRQKEMEQYMHDLTDDITEMVEKMDVNEKNILKQKIAQLASKIS